MGIHSYHRCPFLNMPHRCSIGSMFEDNCGRTMCVCPFSLKSKSSMVSYAGRDSAMNILVLQKAWQFSFFLTMAGKGYLETPNILQR